ncbi:hypothetical protein IHE56_02105 [Streptomyces sp. ID01-12c]|uniref:hypothetical protein n=1 Tax=Streptomyces caniscabiei TaxID=2746961 RepID=UPI0017842C6E|nr:hypothetical protein [Streptomyces caniscabiei]MBD9700900.1 hypothetical protein [Streptomyces caniscabiei]MDX3727553.1 hypothetical protein [Streptomyces caniscabiei]
MNASNTSEWWERLPAGIREQVDGYVLQDAGFQAIRVVFTAGRALGLGLVEAQHVVNDRYLHHGDRVARTPDSPLDPDSLAALAAGCPGRVTAIEAVWDGDTFHDWFVELLALTADPAGEHRLATLYRATAERYLGEEKDRVMGHPSAVAAGRCGRALAARLSVPFRFASPHTPDDRARWDAGDGEKAGVAGDAGEPGDVRDGRDAG